jgi:putative Ca2+/H+ antiporter (TMEM165/GDT1 family)
LKTILFIFLSVFLAELGDKTQLATMLYATNASVHPAWVFAAASAALVVSTLLAVLLGSTVTQFVSPSALKLSAGIAFIGVGIWTIATR